MPKVLLVEDNVENRDMLQRRLARRGYEVIVAESGLEGVEKARTERPDLVLMDVNLPEMDGWEATRRIKADRTTAGLPVIALTARAMTGDREKSLAAGCDDYHTKPVDLSKLLEQMEALVKKR